jgi:hypothetical protein
MKFWCLVMAASYSFFWAFSRFWSSFWNRLLKLADNLRWSRFDELVSAVIYGQNLITVKLFFKKGCPGW